jgi:hypothetical protein
MGKAARSSVDSGTSRPVAVGGDPGWRAGQGRVGEVSCCQVRADEIQRKRRVVDARANTHEIEVSYQRKPTVPKAGLTGRADGVNRERIAPRVPPCVRQALLLLRLWPVCVHSADPSGRGCASRGAVAMGVLRSKLASAMVYSSQ